MTGPAVIQKPNTRILTGDEWEQSQYAPHRLGSDPTKPMPGGRILTGDEWEQASAASSFKALTFPAMPRFAADATSRLNPNTGPVDRSIPEQMGSGVRNAAAMLDAASMGADANLGAGFRLAAIMGRQVVAPAVEHPLLTAALANPVGAVVGTGMAVHTIAQYGWQKAHELGMSDEDRAKAEADPNRVSGEAAAVQAVMLGLGGLAGVHSIAKAADVSGGMMEAGAAGLKGFTDTQFGADALKTAELKAQVTQSAAQYFESQKGAEVLGTAAAHNGLPETASPYPPDSPLAAAWQDGHAAVAAPASKQASMPLVRYDHEGKAGIVTPSAKEPGRYQATYFHDAEATRPAGDIIADTHDAAVAALEAKGYDISSPPKAADALPPTARAKYEKLADDYSELLDIKDHGDEWTPENEGELQSIRRQMRDIVAPTPPRLASVDGTGETKTRGLSLSVEQRAYAKELTDYLGELPEYRTVNMADQAAQSLQLLEQNPDLARRIALGEADAPHGLIPEAVFKAVENKALAEGDVATIRDLASGKLTEQATTMGQRLRALGERDPESPVAAIQRITDARSRIVGDVPNATAKVLAEIERQVKKANGSKQQVLDTFTQFIDAMRC